MDTEPDLNDFLQNCHKMMWNNIVHKAIMSSVRNTSSLFNTYYSTRPDDQSIISDALETLSDLRNNETHFFIDKWTFLTESKFQKLYN